MNKLSIFHDLKQKLGDRVETTNLTKLTLVHISHTLEEMVIDQQLDALIFTGFQESSYWKKETDRYIQLADRARGVYIFAGKPLPESTHVNTIHVELHGDDPLRQEWFLLIFSDRFSALLCGQDNMTPTIDEAHREFETILSFDLTLINDVIQMLHDVLLSYDPAKAAALSKALEQSKPVTVDQHLIAHFSIEMIRFQERLNNYLIHTNEELKQQRGLNDLLIEISPAFIVAIDQEGKVIALNQALARSLKLEVPDTVTRTSLGLIPVELLGLKEVVLFGQELPASEQWESRLTSASGEDLIVEWRSRAVTLDELYAPLYLAIGFDVTYQRAVQDALARSEAHLREVITSIPQYVYVLEFASDGHHQQTYASPQFEELTGYMLRDVMSSFEFWTENIIHPDDYDPADEQLKKLLTGQSSTIDYRIIRRNGEIRWVKDTAHAILQEENGKLIVYGVVEDVTERKEADLLTLQKEKLRLELDQERELNEMQNKLMTTISHEFRTPLATILSSVQLVRNYRERMDKESIDKKLNSIEDQVIHLREMMDDIVDVIRVRKNEVMFDPRQIDLVGLIESTVEDIKQFTATQKTFITEYENLPETVSVDPRLLRQALRNLLINAIAYSALDSKILVYACLQERHLIIKVTNFGNIIPASDIAYIFDPFYRGRNAEHITGSGLGLKLVKDYVTMHKGTITCTSKTDEGTVFKIELPFIQ